MKEATSTDALHEARPSVHVEISPDTLDLAKLIEAVKSPKAGAISTFIGTTRDTFQDKTVLSLSYEAYIPLALKSLRQIAESLLLKYHGVHGIAVAHRIGAVPVGETSVIICVSSTHRPAAIGACEELIDRLKEETAIWKKETYGDGTCSWKQNCECKRNK